MGIETITSIRRARPLPVCLPEIKSEHIRDAVRRGLVGKEYPLPSLRCALAAHPYPRPSASVSHCSRRRMISESGADAPMITQEGSPSLAAWHPPFDHVLGDARLRDLKSQL